MGQKTSFTYKGWVSASSRIQQQLTEDQSVTGGESSKNSL